MPIAKEEGTQFLETSESRIGTESLADTMVRPVAASEILPEAEQTRSD